MLHTVRFPLMDHRDPYIVRAVTRGVRIRVLALLTACLLPAALAAQDGTGILRGSVRAATVGAPLAYAVVRVPSFGIERFTDGDGRFALTGLAPGAYDVEIRRIGFVPFRGQVRIQADVTTTLDVSLDAIPVRIGTLTVLAVAQCTAPGVPDSSAQPAVAALVSLLRENADRYRLLASEYPFTYRQLRALVELVDADDRDSPLLLQRVDTILAESATKVEYRPGKVVQRQRLRGGSSEYSMALPTILDLADDRFARAHCFNYAGREEVETETWLRLAVRAADRLGSPDVHGVFFLDSASSQLRRMDLELSRPDKLPRQLRGIASVQVRTRFQEIAPGLSIISEVCAVNRLKRGSGGAGAAVPAELQLLAGYAFTNAPTGVLPYRDYALPNWRRGNLESRSALWCVEED